MRNLKANGLERPPDDDAYGDERVNEQHGPPSKQMAADKNLEGAAYVSEKLNSTCIACHQYLRDELPRIPKAVQHAN